MDLEVPEDEKPMGEDELSFNVPGSAKRLQSCAEVRVLGPDGSEVEVVACRRLAVC
jgi:hypothetical protein